MAHVSPRLNVLISVVKKATNAIARDFNEIERLQVSKNYMSFVINAVQKIEKNLIFEFNKVKPDMPVSKELLSNAKSGYFLINPLDGLENLSRGIPFFAICASMVDADNNVLASVIYNPVLDEMYFADKSNGAYKEGFRNIEKMRVSDRRDLEQCVISSNVENLGTKAVVRNFGVTSLSFAYLASSKVDAIVSFDSNVASLAAGLLMVKESGGSIFDVKQKDIRTEDLPRILTVKNVFAVNMMLDKKVYELVNNL